MLQKREPYGIGFDPEYTREELAEVLEIDAIRLRKTLVEMAHRVLPRTREVMRQRSKTVKDPETGEKTRTTWKEAKEVEYEFNPGSWQQIKALYAQAGIELASTDEKTMLPRAERGDEFAATLLKWRGLPSSSSTYVVSLLEKQNPVLGGPRPRLFTTYKLHGTVTGRLSSENPNIQNIPREKRLRRMFVPYTHERLHVQVDMSQAELRVIAAEAGDPYLLELFHNPDVDIFTQMLPGVFPHVDFTTADDATKKELRAKLKGVIYGLNFGRGARAIAGAIGSLVGRSAAHHRHVLHQRGQGRPVARERHSLRSQRHTAGVPFRTSLPARSHHTQERGQRRAVSAELQAAVEQLGHQPLAPATLDEIEDKGWDWHIVALVTTPPPSTLGEGDQGAAELLERNCSNGS